MLCLMRGALAALFIAVVTAAAFAQEATIAATQRQEILALLTRAETAFANSDAHGLAACWTPTGEFVGPNGASADSREAIEKLFEEAFTGHKRATLKLRMQRFRLVNDGLALVDAVAEFKPALATGGTPLASFVVVKHEGHWLIESVREVSAHLLPDTNHLKELQWLVGQWASSTSPAGITLRVSCDWTANQSFLIRKFQAEGKNVFLHGGTEIIGWDPRTASFRSWIFDSDGGFGENLWVRDGGAPAQQGRWLVKYSGTLADGNTVSATHVVAKVDDNTITTQSKDRTFNGAPQPDVPELTLSRQAPVTPPAKAAAPAPSTR